ncbi:MAG TPA: ABC transporter substrate-binding protein [Chloroflexota bacterium]|nr:ABC transporter substrate-binding protein [Chloroflexota bacterium]
MFVRPLAWTGALTAALVLAACGGPAAPAASPSAPAATNPAPSTAAAGVAAAKPSAGASAAKPAASASASAGAKASVAVSGTSTVHVAFSGAGTDATFYIAQDKGYFAEQGINIDSVRLNSSDMPAQLAAGSLDVGGGSFTVSLINAIQRGLDIKLVADKARCLPGTGALQIVVRKDLYDSGKVRGPKDFKGLTFGIQSVGSGNEVELDLFLKQGGLGINDVTRKPLTYPDMPAAFNGKAVDATSAPEPTPSQLVHQGLAVSIAKCGDYNPNGEISMILYGPKFIQQHDVAQRFMNAYLKAVRYYDDAFVKHTDPALTDEAINIIAKGTKVDPAVYKEMNANNNMWGIDADGQMNTKSFQTDQDFWVNVTKELKQPIDLNQLIDPSFAQAAAQALGPYKL